MTYHTIPVELPRSVPGTTDGRTMPQAQLRDLGLLGAAGQSFAST
jgi:hypothetical protein